jgi:prolyl-tRNA synthetase
VGVKNMPILVDEALRGRRNLVAGANRDDHHLRHVTPEEDFKAEFHDLRQVVAGDPCATCGEPLELKKSIEIGHIFKLGYKYSDSMGLRVLNAAGEEIPVIMGSYGIGIERILSAAVEQWHDSDGMALGPSIAPFTVVVTPVNRADEAQRTAAEQIYGQCLALGMDTLLDDRDERPGVKFKDADLIGVPFRITVGKKLAQGMVELVERRGKKTSDVAVADAPAAVKSRL